MTLLNLKTLHLKVKMIKCIIFLIFFKHIDPEFDLATLSYEEILKFYKFAEHSNIMYMRNPYFKGFWLNFMDIINGV